MKRDPLRTMLRVRQSALDEAQRALGDAYAREQDASSKVEIAADAIGREMRAAMNLTAGDDCVESFARWLPVGRSAVSRARELQRAATIELDRVRATLSLARAGVRAVELLIEQRDRLQDLESRRKEQVVLDDAGRRAGAGH